MNSCRGFDDISLEGIQTDQIYEVQIVDKDNFQDYEYSHAQDCFIYFTSPLTHNKVLHKVRFDNLLALKCFPNVFNEDTNLSNESDLNNDDAHPISHTAIDNDLYLKQIKEIHDFMYSFEPKTCSTCKNRWFVTNSNTPDNEKIDILDPRKNKSCFQFNDTQGTECDRCKKDIPPDDRLPKLYSARNNMDFGPMFDEISALTPFEEMLIAKVSTLVSVCTLTSTGFLSYQGHSVSFYQDSVQWFNKIPRRASACEFILIVRKGATDHSKRKAFKVNRVRIRKAIEKLREVNKLYGPDNVEIDEVYLNSLPEDDIPSDLNVIEREMNDLININKDFITPPPCFT